MSITWKPTYTTGDASLDEQHRRLFDLFNRLETVINQGDYDSLCVQAILDEIGADLQEHFQCEEGCMARHRCPMADKNKQEHDRLMAMYQQFRAGYAGRKSPDALENFHRDAEWWLLEHVCFVDIHLRSCSRPASGG